MDFQLIKNECLHLFLNENILTANHFVDSALGEQENKPSVQLNPDAVMRWKSVRRKKLLAVDLLPKIIEGDKTALSRGITLVESRQEKHRKDISQLIEGCLPHANKSVRIGVTGVPGVGKSTFIEALGTYLVETGYKVAVLAIDPSSSVSHGSILGDKIRMPLLARHENAFIRPTPSGDSLGGVARKTRETIVLCEAAGFDAILIETVGVGQSETLVHSMTDFFLLLKLAGAGDGIQGIKRGIMEMADAVVINKADGDNLAPAKKARHEFRKAIAFFPDKESGWRPEVKISSALENRGIESVWKMIRQYEKLTKENRYFELNRRRQSKFWLIQTIEDHLKTEFYQHPKVKKALEGQLQAVEKGEITPFTAADFLLQLRD